jgi:predicted CXXCH cytochrome family protein
LLIIAVLVLLVATGGCSPQRQYRVLSFFFDGVPDPNAPKLQQSTLFNEPGSKGPVKLAVIHKPYAEGNCRSCHSSLPNAKPETVLANGESPATAKDLKLVALDSSLCVNCHKDKPGQFKVMHGPVASAACMWCHEPHQSDNPALLKSTSAELCLQCHDRQLLTSAEKEHQNETKSCLDCHLGHGGPDTNLLRPTTQPSKPAAQLAGTRPAVAVASMESRPVPGPERRTQRVPAEVDEVAP